MEDIIKLQAGLSTRDLVVNEKGPNGWTPLHMTAIGGHRMLTELLLDKGADIIALTYHSHQCSSQ